MSWIRNVSMGDIKTGQYLQFAKDTSEDVLIQIVDPAYQFPQPKSEFKEVHQFEFLDAEDKCGFDDDFKISPKQAQELVKILENALANNQNVLVHCHQGLCRSGAVAEVGVMMGFDDTGAKRQPNVRVKTSMMRVLGWTYDSDDTTSKTIADENEIDYDDADSPRKFKM